MNNFGYWPIIDKQTRQVIGWKPKDDTTLVEEQNEQLGNKINKYLADEYKELIETVGYPVLLKMMDKAKQHLKHPAESPAPTNPHPHKRNNRAPWVDCEEYMDRLAEWSETATRYTPMLWPSG